MQNDRFLSRYSSGFWPWVRGFGFLGIALLPLLGACGTASPLSVAETGGTTGSTTGGTGSSTGSDPAVSCSANVTNWNQYSFSDPKIASLTVADANHVFGTRSDTGAVIQWQFSSGSWSSTALTQTGVTTPALAGLTAAESGVVIDVFGIRNDNGHVNRWQGTSGSWSNGDLVVTSSPSDSGPALSQIAAMDANNVFGIRADTGTVNQWYYDPAAQAWHNGDLEVTSSPQNHGPAMSAIAVTETTGVYSIFGIRSDNGHVNVWQWAQNNWINVDLTVTGNPGASLPQYTAISVAPWWNGMQNIYGIRADNHGYLNQWQWTPATTQNGQSIPAKWANYDFGPPSLEAVVAADALHVFGIRADTHTLVEWQYDLASQKWSLFDFCGRSLSSLVSMSPSSVFGIQSGPGDLLQWTY